MAGKKESSPPLPHVITTDCFGWEVPTHSPRKSRDVSGEEEEQAALRPSLPAAGQQLSCSGRGMPSSPGRRPSRQKFLAMELFCVPAVPPVLTSLVYPSLSTEDTTSDYYLNITNHFLWSPVEVTLGLYSSLCQYFSEEEERWKTEGMAPLDGTTPNQAVCLTQHLTAFGASLFVPPHSVQFIRPVSRSRGVLKGPDLGAPPAGSGGWSLQFFCWAARCNFSAFGRLRILAPGEGGRGRKGVMSVQCAFLSLSLQVRG